MSIVNVSLYVLRMREDHIFKIFLVLSLQIFYVTGCEPNQRRSTPAITTQTTFKPATTTQTIETSKEYFCEECGEIAGQTITGGREAYPNKYPWQVFIGVDKDEGVEVSGGFLISRNRVITAAHCVYGKSVEMITVLVGNHNWKEAIENDNEDDFKYIIKIDVFPKYIEQSKRNPGYKKIFKLASDVAVLTLESDVTFSSKVKPICLPPIESKKKYTGQVATVTGWGYSKARLEISDVLYELRVPVMENNICRNTYPYLKE